ASSLARGIFAKPRDIAERFLYRSSTLRSSSSRSSRTACMRFANPKKSSARRKKPRCVRLDQTSFNALANFRTESSVRSEDMLSLPTAIEPAAQAIASNRVDLPEPFSPTRNVTGEVNSISLNDCTAGTLNGKPDAGSGNFDLREMDLR